MYDNIIIHSYPNDKSGIHSIVSFRNGKKIMIGCAMKDVSAALSYIENHDFCKGLPCKVITHKGEKEGNNYVF